MFEIDSSCKADRQSEEGSWPVSWLLSRYIDDTRVIRPRLLGTDPTSLFLLRFTNVADDIRPKALGIEPDRELPTKDRALRELSRPREEGSVPNSLFANKPSMVRPLRFPMLLGIVPDKPRPVREIAVIPFEDDVTPLQEDIEVEGTLLTQVQPESPAEAGFNAADRSHIAASRDRDIVGELVTGRNEGDVGCSVGPEGDKLGEVDGFEVDAVGAADGLLVGKEDVGFVVS